MSYDRLFDPSDTTPEALARTVEETIEAAPHDVASAARVDFLAGMLSTWAIGPGAKPSAVQREHFQNVARDAIWAANKAASW